MSKDPGYSNSKTDRQGSQIRVKDERIKELEAELFKTKQALRDTANGKPIEWAYVQLKEDFDRVTNKLDIAREALNKIAEDFGTDYCDGNTMMAYEALEQIREVSDERKLS